MRATVYKEVEVDIEMEDFDDYELIDELENRGFEVAEKHQKMLNIELNEYQYRRLSDILEEHGVNNGPDYRIYEEIKKLAYG